MNETKKKTTSQLLAELGMRHSLFHTKAGVAYAEVEVGNHREVWQVESEEYGALLSKEFYNKSKKVATDRSLKEAKGVIKAQAIYEGSEREVSVRVAGVSNGIFIDLANSDWNSLAIGAYGWRQFDRPYFTRKFGMLELPTPTKDGSLAKLRQFVNMTDEQWILYQAFLVSCLQPNGPYWILVLNGLQGSGKSVLSAITRSLIDPNQVVSQGSFKTEQDLVIAAHNSHLVVLDNLSKINDTQSDALCRLVTGSGYRGRKLYTNSGESLLQTVNPIVLNGITNFVTRPDLEDRSLQLWLRPLEKLKSERDFWEEFERAKPSILGGLYTAASTAVSRLGEVEVPDHIRMVDSFRWALAAEPALDCEPGGLLEAYQATKARRNQEILANDPLTELIRLLAVENCKNDNWVVSPKNLRSALIVRAGELEIPAPAQLGNHLMRNIPVLTAAGVKVTKLDRTAKGAQYEFSVGSAG